MKIKVPNNMIEELSKDNEIKKEDKERLELYLGSWSSKKGYGILHSETFDIIVFDKLKIMLEKIKDKTNEHNYLKRQLKLLYDIIKNPEGAVAKKLEDLADVLRKYIKENAKDLVIFEKVENNLYPNLVCSVQYCRPSSYNIAHVEIKVKYIEFDKTITDKIEIYRKDMIGGKNAKEVLDGLDIYLSNKELLKEYEKEFKVFDEFKEMIGKQFLGSGMAFVQEGWGSSTAIPLEIEGIKSKLIVDEFKEEDYNGRRRYSRKENLEIIENIQGKDYRIPTHVNLYCFNLNMDEYVKVHVNNLEIYKYDPTLIDKLILPKGDKDLITILIDGTKDIMEDIVKGKTGGIIVMATGIAGTGKTLTAEVYSEVVEKPLYIVQSSQLGVEIRDLESNLKKILERASRWNAILLIDEADVYVHERGDDLVQNAVVGVFLRLLEYYKGILFMTSNRETKIDDAILSRATAHIRYNIPTEELSKKIWKVLSEQFKIKISDKEIDKIYPEFTEATGRDIKSLLKLSGLLAKREKRDVNCELIKYVSKFLDVETEHKEVQIR